MRPVDLGDHEPESAEAARKRRALNEAGGDTTLGGGIVPLFRNIIIPGFLGAVVTVLAIHFVPSVLGGVFAGGDLALTLNRTTAQYENELNALFHPSSPQYGVLFAPLFGFVLGIIVASMYRNDDMDV